MIFTYATQLAKQDHIQPTLAIANQQIVLLRIAHQNTNL